MTDQNALWLQVEGIKRRVAKTLGEAPSHQFRSGHAYQAYTALCGEAWWAHQENELDARLVQMLQESAENLINIWNTQRGTHAQN